MVMVEGEASMSSYVDAEGKPRQVLNITQRMLPSFVYSGWLETLTAAGNLDVLRRPYNPTAGEGEQQQ